MDSKARSAIKRMKKYFIMVEESILQEDTIVNRCVLNIIFPKYLHDIKFQDKVLKFTILFEYVYHSPFYPIQEDQKKKKKKAIKY